MAQLSEILPKDLDQGEATLLYGGGGHGKTLIDLARAAGRVRIVGIVDDGLKPGTEVLGIPVLGGAQVLLELRTQGVLKAVNGVGGIGDVATRVRIFEALRQSGFSFPQMIHPSAMLDASAELSDGVQILAGAYIGSSAQLGFGVLVNTGAIVSHDCVIGEYSGVAPGAMLAGEVEVGSKVQIGMGVTINLGLKIGDEVTIGNSAVIKADVPQGTKIRAGQIWPVRRGD